MSRIRTIKPGFFKNESLAELAPLTRLLFIGLWTLADRRGRLEDRPKRIKAEILPYEEYDIEKGLSDLVDSGFIIRYEVEQNAYIQIVTFEKHQHVNIKESESCIPPIPQKMQAPCKDGADTVPARQEQEQEQEQEGMSVGMDARDFENEIEKVIQDLKEDNEKKLPLGRAADPLPTIADLSVENPAIQNTYTLSRKLPPERFEELVNAFDAERGLNKKTYDSASGKIDHFLKWAANRIRIEQETKQRPARSMPAASKSTITQAGRDVEHYRKPQAF